MQFDKLTIERASIINQYTTRITSQWVVGATAGAVVTEHRGSTDITDDQLIKCIIDHEQSVSQHLLGEFRNACRNEVLALRKKVL